MNAIGPLDIPPRLALRSSVAIKTHFRGVFQTTGFCACSSQAYLLVASRLQKQDPRQLLSTSVLNNWIAFDVFAKPSMTHHDDYHLVKCTITTASIRHRSGEEIGRAAAAGSSSAQR